MKNQKGMTLLEIVVAIALLGIIAAGFLSAFTTYYSWMMHTKEQVTVAAFNAQEVLEENISKLKIVLQADLAPDPGDYITSFSDILLFDEPSMFDATLYSRVGITVFEARANLGGHDDLVTWVGETRLPALPVPEVAVTGLNFVRSGITSTNLFDRFEYMSTFETGILANGVLASNPQNSFYLNKHEWYVSDPGFLIPATTIDFIDEDVDMGRIYPRFPQDYRPIPIFTQDLNASFSSLLPNGIFSLYSNRHIIYTVTPYSKALKMGVQQNSLPMYVMAMPSSEDLLLHMDSSKISPVDSVRIQVLPNGELALIEWPNLWDSPVKNNPYKGVQSDTALRPVLVSEPIVTDPDYLGPELAFQQDAFGTKAIWGRALGNRMGTTASTMARLTFGNLTLDDNGFDLWLVMRRVAQPFSPEVLAGPILQQGDGSTGWALSWSTDQQLELMSNTMPSDGYAPSFSLAHNQWYLVNLVFEADNLYFHAYNMGLGQESVFHEATTDLGRFSGFSAENLTLNFNGIQVAELLVYTALTQTKRDAVKTQLLERYNPGGVVMFLSILQLETPLRAETLFLGQSYTLPNRALAVMSDGSYQQVDLVWDNTIDVNVAGEQTVIGRSVVDSTKTTTITVTVLEGYTIESLVLSQTNITLTTGTDFALPETLPGTVLHGGDLLSMNLSVAWFLEGVMMDNLSGLSEGVYLLRAESVEEPSVFVNMTVTIED